MQLFCLPTPQTNDINNGMAWLPERPIGPRLSEDAFAHPVKVVPGGFIIDRACFATCFFAWPLDSSTSSFCLNIPSKYGVHPHINLNLPRNASMGSLDLLVYLNTSTGAPTLLADSRGNGAVFLIKDRRNDTVRVKYHCSLRFRNCWKVHESTIAHDHIPTAVVSKKLSVFIAGKRAS